MSLRWLSVVDQTKRPQHKVAGRKRNKRQTVWDMGFMHEMTSNVRVIPLTILI